MQRTNISSGAEWESLIGYSRAVRKGNVVHVSGTVAVDEAGNVVGEGDPKAQTKYILEKIWKVLAQAGTHLEDVVRTRIYVTDISRWKEVGEAHAAFFTEIKPATSMVEVRALIKPEYMVEIEVEAICAPKE
ncbi:MAG: RidA family protein [Moraxellaceae bacterium]|nr:MAG: RidA family protein [Moraxellaceae bacterium]